MPESPPTSLEARIKRLELQLAELQAQLAERDRIAYEEASQRKALLQRRFGFGRQERHAKQG